MRILLDTNIIIHREASRIYNQDIGLLFNWIDKLHYEKCVHPLTIEEIGSYQDEEVVNTMRVKIGNYNQLKTDSPETEKISILREADKSRNDFIDTSLLKEVLNSRVDFLITEDKGIHRKAKFLGIADKIYKIDAFIDKCTSENPDLKIDIDGSEYKIIDEILQYSNRIEMLIFEFHFIDDKEFLFLDSVKKLKDHFEIIHIHGNNHFSKLDTGLPIILEITLLNKKYAPKNVEYVSNFPIKDLDYPNNPYKDDLIFNFQN